MKSPLVKILAEKIHTHHKTICEWYLEQLKVVTLPFYSSVDLRDSGYKITPVDHNLYPAGFNNICPEDLHTAPHVFKKTVENFFHLPHQKSFSKVLILPEAHTKNKYYIENLHYLKQLIERAGFEVQMGWMKEDGLDKTSNDTVFLESISGYKISALPIEVNDGVLKAGNFIPDFILLNNDFSGGYPKVLDRVNQPIFPSHLMGWHSRKKSRHFHHYNRLALEFAKMIEIDPWLIQIDTQEVSPVDFDQSVGIDLLASKVEEKLIELRHEYSLRKINREPFLFIKNNTGTYGMGIMVAYSKEDILQANRRVKNKMSVGKNNKPIESIIIQEGIPTLMRVNEVSAEPVIYLFGNELVGGFLRTNTEKGDEDNLNSHGMVFQKLCMSDLRQIEDVLEEEHLKDIPLLELVYGSIAKLSVLATGWEIWEQRSQDAELNFEK